MITVNRKWISRCETGFLTYVNLTMGRTDFRKSFAKATLAPITNFRVDDFILGTFKRGISIHYIYFEVFQTYNDVLLDIDLVLEDGFSFRAPKIILERGKITVDLDTVPDPRTGTEERQGDQGETGVNNENSNDNDNDNDNDDAEDVEDWKSQIVAMKIRPNTSIQMLKFGCFGFWIKELQS